MSDDEDKIQASPQQIEAMRQQQMAEATLAQSQHNALQGAFQNPTAYPPFGVTPSLLPEVQLRIQCLQSAVQVCGASNSDKIIATAQAFYDFMVAAPKPQLAKASISSINPRKDTHA